MRHSMAIGAQKSQVFQLCLGTRLKGMQGTDMVSFDIASASVTVALSEIKIADLAGQVDLSEQHLGLLSLYKLAVSFPVSMYAG